MFKTLLRGSAASLFGASLAGTVWAADFSQLPPLAKPYGYIAAPTLDRQANSQKLFGPSFTNPANGDLKAYRLEGDGLIGTELWSFNAQLTGTADSSRSLYWGAQRFDCGATPEHSFICGDNHDTSIVARVRTSQVGGVVHSTPVYVGNPNRNYRFGDYSNFARQYQDREHQLLVATNSGWIHSLNAGQQQPSQGGQELFGYLPSHSLDELRHWTSHNSSRYFNDGAIQVADVNGFNNRAEHWKTVAVVAQGAGGRGLIALDITDPNQYGTSPLLWEYSADDFAELGFTYSAPEIGRIRLNGKAHWAVFTGNGYGDQRDDPDNIQLGQAHLLILPMVPNAFEPISVALGSDDGSNGLSSPTLLDSEGDHIADWLFVGDANGRLWKIDLRDGQGMQSQQLFEMPDQQPILTAPMLSKHPQGGWMLYAGSGDYLNFNNDTSTSHLVGLRIDPLQSNPMQQSAAELEPVTLSRSSDRLLTHSTGDGVQRGWIINTTDVGQLLQPMQLLQGNLHMTLHQPNAAEHWVLALDALRGDSQGRNPVFSPASGILRSGSLLSQPTIGLINGRFYSYTNSWIADDHSPEPLPLSCSKIILNRFEYELDGSNKFGLRMDAHLSNDRADDLWLQVAELREDNFSNAIFTPANGHPDRGAGSDEEKSWQGLSMGFKNPGSERLDLHITYQGPYRIDSFTLTGFKGRNNNPMDLEEVHEGITVQQCDSNCGNCSSRYKISRSDLRWNRDSSSSGQKLVVISDERGLFNPEGTDAINTGEGAFGDSGQTSLSDPIPFDSLPNRRIKWRELFL